MKKQFISIIILASGFLIGASALSALAVWTPPPSNPPTCIDTFGQSGYHPGCVRPINAGDEPQAKTGLLGLQSLQFLPGAVGSVTAGSVLTATDANGVVGWAPAGGGAVQVIDDFTSYTTSVSGATFNIPAGTSKLIVEVWGGGGSAFTISGYMFGGGGGGYAKAVMNVSGVSTCSVTVGNTGNNSTVSCGSGGSVTANGGTVKTGGGASGSGTASLLTITGGQGEVGQNGAAGGDSPNGGSGGKSGWGGVSDNCQNGVVPGGGGAGLTGGGGGPCLGAVGRVVIWY